jgi:succinylglutamate desuccinylase
VATSERLIGKYNGTDNETLVVFTAAMHGNERAGVDGLMKLFAYLGTSSKNNLSPTVYGKIIGLTGNEKAFKSGKRYIEKDMNRCWLPEDMNRITNAPINSLQNEDLEIRQFLETLSPELSGVREMFMLDLHTTSSEGGIFCISGQKNEAIHLAHKLGVPVVLGLLEGLQGTTLQYFDIANTGIDTISIAFEAGHHDDPLSAERCFQACLRFLKGAGCLQVSEDFSGIINNDAGLGNSLPEIVKVTYRQPVEKNSEWRMKPGYRNFQKVCAGESLATYEGKEVVSPADGYLLMPLYQVQGKDGFFIAEEIFPGYKK